jgi:A/G-specific adenine glycosylase
VSARKRAAPTHQERADALCRRIEQERFTRFGRRLRAWYRRHARDLPWRRTRDPYAILVSELMLQQTQVSRVVDYYERFLARFPSLGHVAQAPLDHVLEQWEGLGYYARARNLHKLAGRLTDGGATAGVMPSDPEALRALPGIGAYTAGAVATFAYERRAPLVDTNVARVLLRCFAPAHPPKSAMGQRVAWALAERTLPPRGGRVAWEHNQALMEVGALVCTARIAHCDRCPLRRECRSAVKGGFRVVGTKKRGTPG